MARTHDQVFAPILERELGSLMFNLTASRAEVIRLTEVTAELTAQIAELKRPPPPIPADPPEPPA